MLKATLQLSALLKPSVGTARKLGILLANAATRLSVIIVTKVGIWLETALILVYQSPRLGSATIVTGQATLLQIAAMRRPATIAAKPATLLESVAMIQYAISAMYPAMLPVGAQSLAWHLRSKEDPSAILCVECVISSDTSAATAQQLSPATHAGGEAICPMSAHLAECLNVACSGGSDAFVCIPCLES
ncbi:hypothetical protein MA16_Dca028844 [Dendrobium catenatum]|uniref:Uncharacterized protein n=1 Tax=Dendrobium catenatum TaxID=906689 RepID=A0A2I0V7Z0_9ASPA|nr:hypothetical protein MA16_Dca028844 [Dendrobium catenatum]